MLLRLWREEEGLTTVEYALVLSLVAVAGIVAWRSFGGHVGKIATGVTTAMNGGSALHRSLAAP